MTAKLLNSLLILPAPDICKTSDFYENKLKFRTVKYLESATPHICLYRDDVEIIIIKSKLAAITPNRILHGNGYDGYFTALDVECLYKEFCSNNINIVQPLNTTDYGNKEFVFEDSDGRWIAIGLKTNE